MAASPQLGGTGKDADKGKQRTEFESQRRGGNAGGKDRPPIYKPNDDGERGGYTGRAKPSLIPGRGVGMKSTPTRTLKRTVVSKNAKAAAKKKLGMK